MNPNNPYEGRWRWWYSAIADWMIANPGRPLTDCAKDIGRSYNAISMISNTDMFKSHLADRKREWRERHDMALTDKVQKVAAKGLDLILENMETRKTNIPFSHISEVTGSMLSRLGYAPERVAPAVQVNVNHNSGSQLIAQVTPEVLAEARATIRQVEEMRRIQSQRGLALPAPDAVIEEAELLGDSEP